MALKLLLVRSSLKLEMGMYETKPIILFFVNTSFMKFFHLLKEVRVRFVGFGAEEDEWVNVKNAVRERSIPLEHSECHRLKVGDLVCCFQVF